MPRLYEHEIEEGMPSNGRNGYTAVEYLTLGLVAWLEPCTSYDLKREVERTVSHFWTFSHTALYQAPPQLAAAGLLLEEQEETGRRRRLYRLTPDGRAELLSWLEETSAHPIELRDLALLKLVLLGPHASPGQTYALANAQADYHARRLEEFKALAARYRPEPAHPTRLAALRFGIKWEEAALEFWTELARDEADNLHAGTGSTPRRDTDLSDGDIDAGRPVQEVELL
jgi:PadR family transcriptional regulator, regulatory protein AphA